MPGEDILGLEMARLRVWCKGFRDFCQFSIESWALEAVCEFACTRSMIGADDTEDPRHGACMGQQWKLDCDKTKGLCNRLLLLLDTPHQAFRIAETYLDFEGLLHGYGRINLLTYYFLP